MNDAHYDSLEARATACALDNIPADKYARLAIKRQLKNMTEDGAILRLSDEEERVIRAFRRFKNLLKRDGQTFTWQTRRDEQEIIIPADECVLIADPQESVVVPAAVRSEE